MGRVTSFSLGDHFTSFVDAQVKDGRYGNASDVMRAALRLLEEREVWAGYRKHSSDSHVLYYRLTNDGIDVVRILHERMDHERHIP